MSQVPNAVHTPTGAAGVAVRSGGGVSAEAPDILFVVRHYMWLIVLGTLAGVLVAWVSFLGFRRWWPQYYVAAQFRVLPPPNVDPIKGPTGDNAAVTAEDIQRFILRQRLLVTGADVLRRALDSDAFKQPKPGVKSQWLQKHAVMPEVALRQELYVSAIAGTDVFQVGMSGADREELTGLVNAVADAYYLQLAYDESAAAGNRLQQLSTMQKNLEESIKGVEAALADFRSSHDISAILRMQEINAAMLGALNTEFVKLESELAGARTNLEIIKKQVDAGTLQLNGQTEQFVENDPNIRNLESQKLMLQQEKAVLLANFGPNHRSVQALDTRMAEIAKQADEIREKLRSQARLQILENAQNQVSSAQGRLDEVRDRQLRKDRELKDLDRNLVDYRTREAALADQRELLKRVTEQVSLLKLKSRDDAGRVMWFSHPQVPEPQDISFPKLAYFLPGGFGAGLLLSFALAYLMELTNTRVRTPRDVTRTMQMPLLGFVPDQEDDSTPEGELTTSVLTAPSSMIAESFRQIRGRLGAAAHTKPFSSLLVASVEPGGGATTVACNLATGMALNDLRVLLVDANFYRPRLKNCYKNVPLLGFSDVLSGGATLSQATVAHTELPRLHIMGAGSKPASTASELLAANAFRDLLVDVRGKFDLVIFDGAPMNLVSDSITLAGRVDGVVAVVRAGATKRGTVARVRDQLRHAHATLFGLVLNVAQVQTAGYFRENYRTFHQYAAPQSGATPTPTS